MRETAQLLGKRILLVEDEFMIAMDIEAELEDAGAQVTCASRVHEAVGLVDGRDYDGAILDLNLHGEPSFPVAERLTERGIPFVFHTGHGVRTALKSQFPDALVCNKPCPHAELVASLCQVVEERLAAA